MAEKGQYVKSSERCFSSIVDSDVPKFHTYGISTFPEMSSILNWLAMKTAQRNTHSISRKIVRGVHEFQNNNK